jgi:hypothetical protein
MAFRRGFLAARMEPAAVAMIEPLLCYLAAVIFAFALVRLAR